MKIHVAVEFFHVNRQTAIAMLYNIIFLTSIANTYKSDKLNE
jgi:hypothetical protein